MEGLPGHFDVVVVGTGLVESMVAAACARVGRRVLHLDTRQYYGARNATFSLRQMGEWLRGEEEEEEEGKGEGEGGGEERRGASLAVRAAPPGPSRASLVGDAAAAALFRPAELNLDLSPQLLLCAGAMIDVLRRSGVANYLEFKPLGAHLYSAAAPAAAPRRAAERVPCSKADIFLSSSLPLLQKRQLMKFLQACLARRAGGDAAAQSWLAGRAVKAAAAPDAPPPRAADEPPHGSFAEFAGRQRLPDALLDVALYAILHAPRRLESPADGPSAEEGVNGVCRHLESLGVYGPSAYLANCYGSSELPQAFCRLCAVWGGTYMIHRRLSRILLDDGGRMEAVVTSEGTVRCDWLLLNADSRVELPAAPPSPLDALPSTARCVCVLTAPVLGAEGEELALCTVFPASDEPGAPTVFALQQDAGVAVCPKGKVVLHLSAEGSAHTSARQLLEPVLQRLLELAAAAVPPPPAAAAEEGEEKEEEKEEKEEKEEEEKEEKEEEEKEEEQMKEGTKEDTLDDAAAADGGGEASGAAAAGGGEGQPPDATPARDAPPPREAPQLLWGAFFDLPLRRSTTDGNAAALPANVLPVDDLPFAIDSEAAVERAHQLFKTICPDKPFLPSLEEYPPEPTVDEMEAEIECETPRFIDTQFTTKVEYERWVQSRSSSRT